MSWERARRVGERSWESEEVGGVAKRGEFEKA